MGRGVGGREWVRGSGWGSSLQKVDSSLWLPRLSIWRQSSLASVRTETCMQRLETGAGTVSAGL